MAHILIFGASITYGAWDEEGGWVERLKRFSHQKTLAEGRNNLLVYNLGISGDTTEGLLERFESEVKRRLDQEEKNIIIFSIGVNDSQFVLVQNNTRTSPEKFKENIERLLNIAKKFSSNIIFVGYSPVDESKVDPIPWKPTHSYKNEYIQRYDNIVKKICDKNKILFVGIFKEFMDEDYKSLLEDGVHPNSNGHQKIFEIVKDFLVQNKLI